MRFLVWLIIATTGCLFGAGLVWTGYLLLSWVSAHAAGWYPLAYYSLLSVMGISGLSLLAKGLDQW